MSSSKRGVEAAAMDDAIEHEMKRLRLAYDYCGASASSGRVRGRWRTLKLTSSSPDANDKWTPPPSSLQLAMDDGDTEMEDAAGVDCQAEEYRDANALLREMHFLRQLRKFQAARRAAERHAQQPQLPPTPYPRAPRL